MTRALWRAVAQFCVRRPKLTLALVILYVLSPVDLVPEALVGPLGYVDDLLVVLLPFIAREYLRRVGRPKERGTDVVDSEIVP